MFPLLAGAPAATAQELAHLLTELYGGDGILLETSTLMGAPHAPHFQADSLQELNSLSNDITSALGFFSFNSTVSSYTLDIERGVPVRTTDSLGPILSERATTIGARRLNLGFSYNRVDFKRFEGQDLDDITLFFTHEDVNMDGILGPNPPDFTSDVETDSVRVDLDIRLAQDIYTVYGTFGVTRHFDVGLAIPILYVEMQADAHASVARSATDPPSEDVHNFSPMPMGDEDFTDSSVEGDAYGVGDLLLRGKYNFLRGEGWIPNLAAVGQVRFPTGDEDELLGTGDWRGMGMFVADDTFGPVSPHLNLGYEIVGGQSHLNNLQYIVGMDARLHRRATAVLDLLGRWEPSGDGVGDNLVDVAIGGKYNLWRALVLVTNFIVPLNRNEGLRTDFIWSLGIEYTFGAAE